MVNSYQGKGSVRGRNRVAEGRDIVVGRISPPETCRKHRLMVSSSGSVPELFPFACVAG